jgi:hypothetical protein
MVAGLSQDEPVRILDLGGTPDFWVRRGLADDPNLKISVLNLTGPERAVHGIRCLVGDATDLSSLDENAFDVVFSNSVIEHVGTWTAQQRMACEARRVGLGYFVQTPARSFPIEPHVLLPAFQFLPRDTRRWVLTHTSLASQGRMDAQSAAAMISELRLLSGREMRQLFPGATVYREKIGGLTKSYTAYSIPTRIK